MQRKQSNFRGRAPTTLGDVVASAYDHFARAEFDPVTPRSQRVANYLFARLGAHPQLRDRLFA